MLEQKKTNDLQSGIDILALPAELIYNIIGGERRLLSKAKLVSTEDKIGVNKIAMCESVVNPTVNDWCLATGQGMSTGSMIQSKRAGSVPTRGWK